MRKQLGSEIGVCGVVLILLWIGIFKFTPVEAHAIQRLVEYSPLMSWMYKVGSVQAVSNVIGIFEIITAFLLAISPFSKKIAFMGGLLGTVIFLTTLTFLLSTPGVFRIVDNVPVTDFFILKDIMALGICLQVLLDHWPEKRKITA
ncbi:hypothetical protein FK004_09665 [Flavobacterium kingsejongi]|uniref:DUF417 domain-containing protein n=2 Tax=Flavobacterium kingsejongi TaxID=1678728 RepID=A0A2S1LP21_9FLAO|nr:hypothetical protein FK004_09665 [Flavobacterium kingsejongi]